VNDGGEDAVEWGGSCQFPSLMALDVSVGRYSNSERVTSSDHEREFLGLECWKLSHSNNKSTVAIEMERPLSLPVDVSLPFGVS